MPTSQESGVVIWVLEVLMFIYWTIADVATFSTIFIPSLSELSFYGKLRFTPTNASKGSKSGNNSSSGILNWTIPKSSFRHLYVVCILYNMLPISDLARNVFYGNPCGHSLMLGFYGFFISLMKIDNLLSFVKSFSLLDAKATYNPNVRIVLLVHVVIELHVIQRLYEELFVFKKSNAEMHIFAYVIGMTYYIAMPLTFFLSGLDLKGQPGYLSLDTSDSPTSMWTLLMVGGLALGLSIYQHLHHRILGSLRNNTESKLYSLPKGMLFEHVSCPHYFIEIIFYVVLTSACSLLQRPLSISLNNCNIVMMMLFVILNLSITASRTHAWYKQKFNENQMQNRKAIVPFIF